MFLLDTNVISELRKIRRGTADQQVAAWADGVDANDLYLSVITLEELEIGVLLAERRDTAQGRILRTWLAHQLVPAFAGRILAIDSIIVQRSAALHVPDPRPIRDAFIAATALVHAMTVVTRNVADFASTGASAFNPWLGR